MFKLMIVEDEENIAELLTLGLQKWQFATFQTIDFNEVLNDFLREKPHLILLDINLPVFDGFYWCQKIREVSQVPIIFISSRNTNMDMIMAMNMGGDDFVNKPFSLEILIAKINALLRRTYDYTTQAVDVLEHNGLVLNINNSTFAYGEIIGDLSKNEYQLLYQLMKNHGKILSRDKLLRALWDDERFVDDNTLTVNINRLRKKLEEVGLADFIVTKVGQGYLIP